MKEDTDMNQPFIDKCNFYVMHGNENHPPRVLNKKEGMEFKMGKLNIPQTCKVEMLPIGIGGNPIL